jgi:hypothetical protein
MTVFVNSEKRLLRITTRDFEITPLRRGGVCGFEMSRRCKVCGEPLHQKGNVKVHPSWHAKRLALFRWHPEKVKPK